MTPTAAPEADAIRIVHVGVEAMPDTLLVIDAGRRTYLGLSRDGTYWHSIRPARLEDPQVGDGKLAAGELICSCAAGEFGRRCYWTDIAIACERGERGFVVTHRHEPDVIPAWIQAASS